MIEKTLEAILEELKKLNATRETGTACAAQPAEEEDDLTGGPAEDETTGPTLADVIEATKVAAGNNREKTIALLAKFGAKKAAEVKEKDWAKAIADLGKIKK